MISHVLLLYRSPGSPPFRRPRQPVNWILIYPPTPRLGIATSPALTPRRQLQLSGNDSRRCKSTAGSTLLAWRCHLTIFSLQRAAMLTAPRRSIAIFPAALSQPLMPNRSTRSGLVFGAEWSPAPIRPQETRALWVTSRPQMSPQAALRTSRLSRKAVLCPCRLFQTTPHFCSLRQIS